MAFAEIKPVVRLGYEKGTPKSHDYQLQVVSPHDTLRLWVKKAFHQVDLSNPIVKDAVVVKGHGSNVVAANFGDLEATGGSLLETMVLAKIGGRSVLWEVATNKDTTLVTDSLRLSVSSRGWTKAPSAIDQIRTMQFFDERTAPRTCGKPQYHQADSAHAEVTATLSWFQTGATQPKGSYRIGFRKSVVACSPEEERSRNQLGSDVDLFQAMDLDARERPRSPRRKIAIFDQAASSELHLSASVDDLPSPQPKMTFTGTIVAEGRPFTISKQIPLDQIQETCDTFAKGKVCWKIESSAFH